MGDLWTVFVHYHMFAVFYEPFISSLLGERQREREMANANWTNNDDNHLIRNYDRSNRPLWPQSQCQVINLESLIALVFALLVRNPLYPAKMPRVSVWKRFRVDGKIKLQTKIDTFVTLFGRHRKRRRRKSNELIFILSFERREK